MRKQIHKHTNFSSKFLIPLLFTLLIGCMSGAYWSDSQVIDSGEWSLADTLKFHANISDTTAYYNVFVTVRNDGEYAYSNLFLFIRAEAPNKGYYEDKFELTLSDKSGKWYGDGFGSKFYSEHPYKQNVRFTTSGIYSFEVIHGMREEPLKGLFDVGLKIEKAK